MAGKIKLVLKKVNETKGTYIFGEEGDDADRLKSVYMPRKKFGKDAPDEVNATFSWD